MEIEIEDSKLKEAAKAGMDVFIKVFTSKYKEAMDNKFDASSMALLTGEQHTLLAYDILRDELLEGGFCQLIQNGYGEYIFDNPFAKAMRQWGLPDFCDFIYKAKRIFDKNRADLEKERTDEEFMAMYEQYEVFDDLDDTFIDEEEEITAQIARYVDEHVDEFAKIVK
jgi:hypothetical protein